ncbi:hypothetical protein CBER1_08113 [Cercospora berteroae]|uniref:Uncharacterized protein n=1 Tax=Cercospora berteroae TaxID=357750 RepID=A0A2S6BTA7_9PEZI|nr:hypothetical protein CBER1_08113 [Cercospora berteroae]
MRVCVLFARPFLGASNLEASVAEMRDDASNFDDMPYKIMYEMFADAKKYEIDEMLKMSTLTVSLGAKHSGSPATIQSQSELPISCLGAVLVAVVLIVVTMVTSYVRGYRKESRRREEVETAFRQRVATAWNLQQCHDALRHRGLALEDHQKFELEGDERPASAPVSLTLAGFALIMGSFFLARDANVYPAYHEILSWHFLPAVLALSVLSAISLFRYQAETNDPVYEDTRTDGRVTTTFVDLALPIKDAFTATKQELQSKCSELQERVKAQLPTLVKKLESFTGKDLSLQSILTQTPAYLLVFQTLFINITRSLSPALNPDNLPEAEQDSKLIIMACAIFVLTLAGPAMLLREKPLWNWFVSLSRDSEEERKPLIPTSLWTLSIIWRLLALDLTISYSASTPPVIGTILGECYTSFTPPWDLLFEVIGITSGIYSVFTMGRTILYICGVIDAPIDVTAPHSYEDKKPLTAEQRAVWRKYVEDNVGAPIHVTAPHSYEDKKPTTAYQREVWRKHVEESVNGWRKACLKEEEEEKRRLQLEEAARRAREVAAAQVSEADEEDNNDEDDDEWSEVEKLETEAEVAEWELVPRTVSWHSSTRSDS